MDLVPDINPATRVALVVGEKDDVTPSWLTETYAERLNAQRIDVDMVVIPGGGHEVFLDENVRSAISHFLNTSQSQAGIGGLLRRNAP